MSEKVFGTDGDKVVYAERETFRQQAAEAEAWRAVRAKVPENVMHGIPVYSVLDEVKNQIARLDQLKTNGGTP